MTSPSPPPHLGPRALSAPSFPEARDLGVLSELFFCINKNISRCIPHFFFFIQMVDYFTLAVSYFSLKNIAQVSFYVNS